MKIEKASNNLLIFKFFFIKLRKKYFAEFVVAVSQNSCPVIGNQLFDTVFYIRFILWPKNGSHFNQSDHINIFDIKLKWTIFACKIINVKLRLSTEQEIIRLFKDCGNKIINEKIFNKSVRSFYTQLKLFET